MDHEEQRGGSLILGRRKVLRALGVSLVAAPIGHMLACASSDASVDPGDAGLGEAGKGGSGGARAGAGAGGARAGSGGSSASADAGALSDADVAWATGGTAAMSGVDSYPDPFAAGLGATCALYCSATLGPCYAQTVERSDISEGQDGLPTRLVLLVVDADCKPIEGASVDIWHCGPSGLYSGEDASDFCTSGDATARAARWFRGVQTTDARGRVTFDTCFPGWYSSRTIHIHFTIRLGGSEYVTSQLVFEDSLDDEIVASQAVYATRGARDTQNTNDNVVGGETDISPYTFQTARMSDGAMLAWKTLVIRSSTSEELCSIQGAGGGGGGMPPGGPGGPPDGGFPGGGPRPRM